MTTLPDAHFGPVSSPIPDWRQRPDTTPDDDEFHPVPQSTKVLLGFDPAIIGGITSIPPQPRSQERAASFQEKDHPRGQPKNKGEFAPKGQAHHQEPHEIARARAKFYPSLKTRHSQEVLNMLPHVPFGSNVGRASAHDCHTNACAAARQNKEHKLYTGYLVSREERVHPKTGKKISTYRAAPHSFNVHQGKVVEHTELRPGIERHYFGVPVPKADHDTDFEYKARNPKWVRRQMRTQISPQPRRQERAARRWSYKVLRDLLNAAPISKDER